MPPKSDTGLKKDVLRYIADHGGEIDIARCAIELGVPEADVEKAVELLQSEGRIKGEEPGAPELEAGPPRTDEGKRTAIDVVIIIIVVVLACAGAFLLLRSRGGVIVDGVVDGGGLFLCDVDMIYTDSDTAYSTYPHQGGGGGYCWADDNTIYIRVTGVGPSGRVYSPTTDLSLSMAFTLDNLKQAGTQATPVSFSVRFPATKIGTSTPSNLSISALVSSTSAEGYFETGNVWLLKIANLPGTPNENITVIYTVSTGGKTPGAEGTTSYWTKVTSPLG